MLIPLYWSCFTLDPSLNQSMSSGGKNSPVALQVNTIFSPFSTKGFPVITIPENEVNKANDYSVNAYYTELSIGKKKINSNDIRVSYIKSKKYVITRMKYNQNQSAALTNQNGKQIFQ